MSGATKAGGGQPPPTIPGYRVEGVLGRGATGTVYRAVQVSIGRVVALKVLHPGSVRDTRVVRRLQREARTAARLAHPNIISAIDMGRTADTWWFAMELVEGSSLAERLEHGGRLSERKALAIFIPLCDALQHATEHGVVHRDIKPANILLEHGDRPRLVDLGLARVEEDPLLTRTGATLGTPHYISPEQARDPSSADARSDIWSLGATMFHAVCGRPPFEGDSAAELFSGVLYGNIPDPRAVRPELSKGLSLVLRKCLSRDPSLRYHNAAELREDLERVRMRKAPAVKRSALEPIERGTARRWPPLLAAAAGVLALVALLALRPWESGGTEQVEVPGEGASWPRYEELMSELSGGEVLLAEAWAEYEELCGRQPREREGECRELYQKLYERLEVAFDAFTTPLGDRVGGLLDERRFADAEALLTGGLAAELRRGTGFEPGDLPPRFERSWQLLVERQLELARHARDGALENLVRTLQGYFENNLVGKVAELRRKGRLAEALALVSRTPAELFEDAHVDASGLEPDALSARLQPLDRELKRLAFEIGTQQRRLDSELSSWLEQRARELEGELEARERRTVSDVLAAEFRERLAREQLTLERLREESAEGRVRWNAQQRFDEHLLPGLVERERELLEREAGERFEETEAEARELTARREYGRALELWRARASGPELAPLARMVALRIAEAEELSRFLDRAAAGVAALDGEHVELPVGSIHYPGRLEAERDPLEGGFRIVFDQGGRRAFVLRAPTPGDALDARALEYLARAGAVAAGEELSPLRLALFRFHEGDLDGARQLLGDDAPSSVDDPLVEDLKLRLEEGLDRQHSLRERERVLARRRYEGLTARSIEGDKRKAIADIDALLRDSATFFSPAELERLRQRKRELAGAGPSVPEEFRQVFRIDDVEFLTADERADVRLGYTFDEPVVGTWERGDWTCDGTGWIRGTPVASDEELVRCAAPKLLLVDPFVIGSRLEVRVLLEQPEDSPQNLLVLSAFGFHAAFTRDAGEPRARYLVDTTEMSDVIERARAGEGLPCPPFEPGARHELRLGVTPERGQPYLWIDGEKYDPPLRRSAGNKRSQSVSLRSLNPVLLLEADVRGGRR